MQITSGTTNLLEHYLDLAATQLKVTAGNMANVDTPGFKTVGFDFEAEMRRADPGGEDGESAPVLDRVGGLISRPDGNNVSMDREGMKMADAQLKFKTGIALLRSDFAQISEAIHSDTK